MSLIRILYWICPLSASLLTTCTIAENFLFNPDKPMLFFYREAHLVILMDCFLA